MVSPFARVNSPFCSKTEADPHGCNPFPRPLQFGNAKASSSCRVDWRRNGVCKQTGLPKTGCPSEKFRSTVGHREVRRLIIGRGGGVGVEVFRSLSDSRSRVRDRMAAKGEIMFSADPEVTWFMFKALFLFTSYQHRSYKM